MHAAAGAVVDAFGDDPAELLNAARYGEVGVGGVEVADAGVGAVPGGGGAGGEEVDEAVLGVVLVGVDDDAAGDGVAVADVEGHGALPVDDGGAAEAEVADEVGAARDVVGAAAVGDIAQVDDAGGEDDAGVADGRREREAAAGDGGGVV